MLLKFVLNNCTSKYIFIIFHCRELCLLIQMQLIVEIWMVVIQLLFILLLAIIGLQLWNICWTMMQMYMPKIKGIHINFDTNEYEIVVCFTAIQNILLLL